MPNPGRITLWVRCFGISSVAAFFVVFAFCGLVSAQSNSAIAQGFKSTDTRIVAASLVSLKQDGSNSVELSEADKAGRLIGVVSNNSLIDLSNQGGEVRVVTSGLAMALASDINGSINAGDKITVSPIAGVGMKATEDTVVVGTAQAALDGNAQSEQKTITDAQGYRQTVRIGLIPIQVGVAFFTSSGAGSVYVPPFLRSLANNIAGRYVSPFRILAATIVLALVFVGVGSIMYASVRSSMISIGRNPLSEGAVRRGLLHVGEMTIGMLLLAGMIIYIILKV